MDTVAVRAALPREVAINVARPVSVLTGDSNRPGELKFRVWEDMIAATPIASWELDRETLLTRLRGKECSDTKLPEARGARWQPRPDKATMAGRVIALRSDGVVWPTVYETIDKEFGTQYEWSENGTLHKLVRKHDRRSGQ